MCCFPQGLVSILCVELHCKPMRVTHHVSTPMQTHHLCVTTIASVINTAVRNFPSLILSCEWGCRSKTILYIAVSRKFGVLTSSSATFSCCFQFHCSPTPVFDFCVKNHVVRHPGLPSILPTATNQNWKKERPLLPFSNGNRKYSPPLF